MANRSPEQDLIDALVGVLREYDNDDLQVSYLINKSCKSRKFADVEFIFLSGIHWVIEAKSNDTRYIGAHEKATGTSVNF